MPIIILALDFKVQGQIQNTGGIVMPATHETAVLTEGQLAEFVGAGTKALILIANKLGPEVIRKWANKGEAMEQAFMQALAPEPQAEPAKPETTTRPATEPLPLPVKYGEVNKQIKAGKYDWANDSINAKNFPTAKTGVAQLEAVLVHFDRYMESNQVIEELDKLGLRAGDLDELLAFGITYPNKQREFPIVALGSVVQLDGSRCVPYLVYWHGKRRLDLAYWGGRWRGNYRFLAVRK